MGSSARGGSRAGRLTGTMVAGYFFQFDSLPILADLGIALVQGMHLVLMSLGATR